MQDKKEYFYQPLKDLLDDLKLTDFNTRLSNDKKEMIKQYNEYLQHLQNLNKIKYNKQIIQEQIYQSRFDFHNLKPDIQEILHSQFLSKFAFQLKFQPIQKNIIDIFNTTINNKLRTCDSSLQGIGDTFKKWIKKTIDQYQQIKIYLIFESNQMSSQKHEQQNRFKQITDYINQQLMYYNNLLSLILKDNFQQQNQNDYNKIISETSIITESNAFSQYNVTKQFSYLDEGNFQDLVNYYQNKWTCERSIKKLRIAVENQLQKTLVQQFAEEDKQSLAFSLNNSRKNVFFSDIDRDYFIPKNQDDAGKKLEKSAKKYNIEINYSTDQGALLAFHVDLYYDEEIKQAVINYINLVPYEPIRLLSQDIIKKKDIIIRDGQTWVDQIVIPFQKNFAQNIQNDQNIVLQEHQDQLINSWIKLILLDDEIMIKHKLEQYAVMISSRLVNQTSLLYDHFLQRHLQLLALNCKKSLIKILSTQNLIKSIKKYMNIFYINIKDCNLMNGQNMYKIDQLEQIFQANDPQYNFVDDRFSEKFKNNIDNFQYIIKNQKFSRNQNEYFNEEQILIEDNIMFTIQDVVSGKNIVYKTAFDSFLIIIDNVVNIASYMLDQEKPIQNEQQLHQKYQQSAQKHIDLYDREHVASDILQQEGNFYYYKGLLLIEYKQILKNIFEEDLKLQMIELMNELIEQRPRLSMLKSKLILESYFYEIERLRYLVEILQVVQKFQKAEEQQFQNSKNNHSSPFFEFQQNNENDIKILIHQSCIAKLAIEINQNIMKLKLYQKDSSDLIEQQKNEVNFLYHILEYSKTICLFKNEIVNEFNSFFWIQNDQYIDQPNPYTELKRQLIKFIEENQSNKATDLEVSNNLKQVQNVLNKQNIINSLRNSCAQEFNIYQIYLFMILRQKIFEQLYTISFQLDSYKEQMQLLGENYIDAFEQVVQDENNSADNLNNFTQYFLDYQSVKLNSEASYLQSWQLSLINSEVIQDITTFYNTLLLLNAFIDNCQILNYFLFQEIFEQINLIADKQERQAKKEKLILDKAASLFANIFEAKKQFSIQSQQQTKLVEILQSTMGQGNHSLKENKLQRIVHKNQCSFFKKQDIKKVKNIQIIVNLQDFVNNFKFKSNNLAEFNRRLQQQCNYEFIKIQMLFTKNQLEFISNLMPFEDNLCQMPNDTVKIEYLIFQHKDNAYKAENLSQIQQKMLQIQLQNDPKCKNLSRLHAIYQNKQGEVSTDDLIKEEYVEVQKFTAIFDQNGNATNIFALPTVEQIIRSEHMDLDNLENNQMAIHKDYQEKFNNFASKKEKKEENQEDNNKLRLELYYYDDWLKEQEIKQKAKEILIQENQYKQHRTQQQLYKQRVQFDQDILNSLQKLPIFVGWKLLQYLNNIICYQIFICSLSIQSLDLFYLMNSCVSYKYLKDRDIPIYKQSQLRLLRELIPLQQLVEEIKNNITLISKSQKIQVSEAVMVYLEKIQNRLYNQIIASLLIYFNKHRKSQNQVLNQNVQSILLSLHFNSVKQVNRNRFGEMYIKDKIQKKQYQGQLDSKQESSSSLKPSKLTYIFNQNILQEQSGIMNFINKTFLQTQKYNQFSQHSYYTVTDYMYYLFEHSNCTYYGLLNYSQEQKRDLKQIFDDLTSQIQEHMNDNINQQKDHSNINRERNYLKYLKIIIRKFCLKELLLVYKCGILPFQMLPEYQCIGGIDVCDKIIQQGKIYLQQFYQRRLKEFTKKQMMEDIHDQYCQLKQRILNNQQRFDFNIQEDIFLLILEIQRLFIYHSVEYYQKKNYQINFLSETRTNVSKNIIYKNYKNTQPAFRYAISDLKKANCTIEIKDKEGNLNELVQTKYKKQDEDILQIMELFKRNFYFNSSQIESFNKGWVAAIELNKFRSIILTLKKDIITYIELYLKCGDSNYKQAIIYLSNDIKFQQHILSSLKNKRIFLEKNIGNIIETEVTQATNNLIFDIENCRKNLDYMNKENILKKKKIFQQIYEEFANKILDNHLIYSELLHKLPDYTLGLKIDLTSYLQNMKENRVLQIKDNLVESLQKFGGLPSEEGISEIMNLIKKEQIEILEFPKEAVFARQFFTKIKQKKNKSLQTLQINYKKFIYFTKLKQNYVQGHYEHKIDQIQKNNITNEGLWKRITDLQGQIDDLKVQLIEQKKIISILEQQNELLQGDAKRSVLNKMKLMQVHTRSKITLQEVQYNLNEMMKSAKFKLLSNILNRISPSLEKKINRKITETSLKKSTIKQQDNKEQSFTYQQNQLMQLNNNEQKQITELSSSSVFQSPHSSLNRPKTALFKRNFNKNKNSQIFQNISLDTSQTIYSSDKNNQETNIKDISSRKGHSLSIDKRNSLQSAKFIYHKHQQIDNSDNDEYYLKQSFYRKSQHILTSQSSINDLQQIKKQNNIGTSNAKSLATQQSMKTIQDNVPPISKQNTKNSFGFQSNQCITTQYKSKIKVSQDQIQIRKEKAMIQLPQQLMQQLHSYNRKQKNKLI